MCQEFEYLEASVVNKNFTKEDIKSRLNFGNAYYNSVKIMFSSNLLSEIRIRAHIL
jgi:hypothetical protein